MRLTANVYEPPPLDGYVFWSVMTSDTASKRAILDDAAGEAYTLATIAGEFDVPMDDVKAVLHHHPMMNRRVWHAYIRDVHRAKVIYRLEELALMLRVLKASAEMDGRF